MSSTPKKSKQIENERYEIAVEDWEVYYRFGINDVNKDIIQGDYWEISELILLGKIVSPALEKATRVKINITERPELDDHWKREDPDNPPLAVGWMEIPRSDDTLIMNCWIPSRSFGHVAISVASGKINYVSVFGTKLKRRRGKIFYIRLSAHREED
ncbi:MAG: hypothetical protein ABR911_01630 [Syntrophales bacterium]